MTEVARSLEQNAFFTFGRANKAVGVALFMTYGQHIKPPAEGLGAYGPEESRNGL